MEINLFFTDLDLPNDAKNNCINYYKTKNLKMLYFEQYNGEVKYMYGNDDYDMDYPKIIAIYEHNGNIYLNSGEMYNYVDEGSLGYECNMTQEQIFNLIDFKKNILTHKFDTVLIQEPLFSLENYTELVEQSTIFDVEFFNFLIIKGD
jgi:hypothetical protein